MIKDAYLYEAIMSNIKQNQSKNLQWQNYSGLAAWILGMFDAIMNMLGEEILVEVVSDDG